MNTAIIVLLGVILICNVLLLIVLVRKLNEINNFIKVFQTQTNAYNLRDQVEGLNFTYIEIYRKFLDCWNKLVSSVTLLEAIENEFKNKQE
jgi:hypothetical protein